MTTKFRQKLHKISSLDHIVHRRNVVNGSRRVSVNSSAHLGFDQIFFNNFNYFSHKSRKLPIPAMVKIRQTFK